jgi:hypothetical protein
MNWRESFLRRFGPGLLGGITLSQWLKLLRRYWREIDLPRLPRVIAITAQSLKNSLVSVREHRKFEPLVRDVTIQPPLFILGHWRSGTTYLHELLARDSRFAFPNIFQTSFPQTFLTAEPMERKVLAFFVPKHRPMDNVEWGLASPQEDEFAICALTFLSPCMGWVFPRRRKEFKPYLTFQEAKPTELVQWQTAFVGFLRKLQWRFQRPLVLKSPPHTARIRLLLELFPNARFVHIRRDPYRVFQSTRHTLKLMLDWQGLQRGCLDDLDDWIIDQYEEMYDAFFDQKSSVPAGAFHELSFEQLNQDPLGELSRLYRGLSLPDFGVVEPGMRDYINSLAGFKKNSFPELSPQLKARLARQWKACFDAWGYST